MDRPMQKCNPDDGQNQFHFNDYEPDGDPTVQTCWEDALLTEIFLRREYQRFEEGEFWCITRGCTAACWGDVRLKANAAILGDF
jgi:hypothetical protein